MMIKNNNNNREEEGHFNNPVGAAPKIPSATLLSSLPLEKVFFNVIRPDAPMSIPGRLVAGTQADGGAPLVFEADPSTAISKTAMARTPLTLAQANMFISKRALY
jgi:hypothetical protein